MKFKQIIEGWMELPAINREKYQDRDGLEGPIQTKSGKTVYYDPKAGKYYDPDTDMYMSYDEWRALDEGWCGICGQDVCVCPPGAVSESIEAIKQIVADKSAAKVHGILVDMFTASAIIQVYDAVNDSNKNTIENMLGSKEGLMKIADFAMSKVNEEKISERELTGGEKRSREANVKKLKKHKGDFEKRYGKDAESVMYAVATKRAKGESVEESQLNELDLMAPKKVFVRLGDGSYKLITFRSTSSLFGSGAWDRAMGMKVNDVNDATAKKLQLDQRLDYVLQKTDGTYYKLDRQIQQGHEYQGGLPFSTPDITVYDINTPEWRSDVPVKVQNALNKKLTESKRWKQTSMSPDAATKEYGKENVRVKKGALRNGDDMVEIFVESVADEAVHMERDHEVQMARSDLYKIANYAVKLHKMLKNVSEEEGIQGWMQAKITKAADYMSSVAHTLEYDKMEQNMQFAEGLDSSKYHCKDCGCQMHNCDPKCDCEHDSHDETGSWWVDANGNGVPDAFESVDESCGKKHKKKK